MKYYFLVASLVIYTFALDGLLFLEKPFLLMIQRWMTGFRVSLYFRGHVFSCIFTQQQSQWHPSRSLKKSRICRRIVPLFAAQLYRECLRRAQFVGQQQHNTELLVEMVRGQFKKHMKETNAEVIQQLKDNAARGLINHMLYESEKVSGRKFGKGV